MNLYEYSVSFMTNQYMSMFNQYQMSIRTRKATKWGSHKIIHKLACTVTEAGYKLEILDSESRGTVLSV